MAALLGCLLGAPAAEAAADLGTSGFLGGTRHEWINDVAVDVAGNVYVTGWTTSPDFPTDRPLFGWTGGESVSCDDDECPDAFVAKYAPDGTRIYATYLAGNRYDEGMAIAADAAGHAYVAGRTGSEDFPAGGAPEPYGVPDRAFVAKLAPDGSALEWLRTLGPTGKHGAEDIVLGGDDVYIVGTNESLDFPTTAGAYDRACVGTEPSPRCVETFVARYTTSGALLASTLFGGHESLEEGTAIAIDRAGRPVIAGHSGHTDWGFPTTPGTYDQTPDNSGSEAFAARLSTDLSRLEWAATFGGTDFDDAMAMTLDPQDRPVLVGWTDSRDFPTTPGAIDRQCNNSDDWYDCPANSDGFATKLTADGSALVWSTYIGSYSDDIAYDVASDAQGDVYVTGAASDAERFPLKDAYQADDRWNDESCRYSGWLCTEAFLVRISDAGGLVYGSLLGGGSMEIGLGAAVDPEGDAWIAGVTQSDDFPVGGAAAQRARAGGDCPGWGAYDLPECSDGFLSEFDFTPGSTSPRAGVGFRRRRGGCRRRGTVFRRAARSQAVAPRPPGRRAPDRRDRVRGRGAARARAPRRHALAHRRHAAHARRRALRAPPAPRGRAATGSAHRRSSAAR